MSENTRTRPQPSAEPVAWMYEHHNHTNRSPYSANLSFTRETCGPGYGWTETPLYTADQLQAYGDARAREALERAAGVADEHGAIWTADYEEAAEEIAAAIRNLKENPNG